MEHMQGGWLALVALIVGAVVRLIKSAKLDAVLDRFGIPPVPVKILPWLALVFGALSMLVEARMTGAAWGAAGFAALNGLVAGALAVAGNETLAPLALAIHPRTAQVVFGKDPDPKPAQPVLRPSRRPPPGTAAASEPVVVPPDPAVPPDEPTRLV